MDPRPELVIFWSDDRPALQLEIRVDGDTHKSAGLRADLVSDPNELGRVVLEQLQLMAELGAN